MAHFTALPAVCYQQCRQTDRLGAAFLWVRPEHKDAVLERLLTSTGLSMRHPPGMALVELVLGLHGEELGTHKLNHAGIFKQVECAQTSRQ